MSGESLQLSRAELAVVFQHLWGQPEIPNDTMLAGLELGPDEVAEGRHSLIERGLLFAAPRRSDTALSPSLEPMLEAVTRPRVLGVLQLSSAARTARSAYFSWTPATLVFNRVTEAGDHFLEVIPGPAGVSKAVIEFSALSDYQQGAEEMAPDPEAIVREASTRAVFMAVAEPATDRPATEAVSWLISGEKLWLMAPLEADRAPELRRATAAAVGEEVRSLLEHAIERVRSKADGSGPSATTRPARKNPHPRGPSNHLPSTARPGESNVL